MLASDALPPAWLAGILVLARTIARPLGLDTPSVDAIAKATGASKSQAYEVGRKLAAELPAFVRTPGRPARARPAPPSDDSTVVITRQVLTYVMEHPGCVDRGAEKNRYAESFRRFVLGLRARYQAVELEAFAHAVSVPMGTLKEWLRRSAARPARSSAPATRAPSDGIASLHIKTVLEAWSRWEGSFVDFCEHLRRDLQLPFGRDLVRRILEVEGQRPVARRTGRSPDEVALRGAFRTYFAGAQWVGDGMQVPIEVDGRRFVFNVELDVDTYAGALVGASLRDTEDSAAVIEAFEDGIETTGAAPLALLLDNKPSNHCPEVDDALGATLRIRATTQRPQNKAHVEGAFGLFSQIIPPLILDVGEGARDVARRVLELVVDVWARTTNHRPRRDRGGRSRVDLYAEEPSDEQIVQARRELEQLLERQERARQTLEARRRPEVLALLDDHFARLGLLDPERYFRVALAGYPTNAILAGVSTFAAKKRSNTLPDGADARYLLGIVKNVAAKTEGELFAEILYRNRIEMRDRMLAALRAERDALRSELDVIDVLAAFAVKAMAAETQLRRSVWLDAIVEALRVQPEPARERLFQHATRSIEASFDAPPRERHDAVRYVVDRLVPIP